MKKIMNYALIAGTFLLGSFYSMATDLVTITDGDPVFTPSELVTPVLTAVAAFISACVGIYVVVAGLRWIKRIFGVKS